jgi:hypothetical protein
VVEAVAILNLVVTELEQQEVQVLLFFVTLPYTQSQQVQV